MKYEYKAHCTAVYDGDTITCDIDLGFGVWLKKQKIRLNGINTPELRGGTAKTKAAGRASRDRLRELILEKEVQLETFRDKRGKYGRWIALVYLPDSAVTINTKLVEEGHAVVRNYG